MQKKVLLAFSGGVDSCRAAEILRSQGYAVTALTLDMFGDRNELDRIREKAEALDIPLIALDVRERFAHMVSDYFEREYLRGRTPAPCTVCNRDIKWRLLCDTAAERGFDHIATGHYFNIETVQGRRYVCRAADRTKDQSYYLWPLDQDILARTLTPMGDQIKRDVMAGAGRRYRESMGVCFLRGQGCAEYLRSRFGETVLPGEITDAQGVVVGRHDGIPYYTIGQKKGLGLGFGLASGHAQGHAQGPAQGLAQGLCVTAIDAGSNRLTVGTDDELYHRNLVVSGYTAVDAGELLGADDITVMIRGIGRNPQGYCKIEIASEGIASGDAPLLHVRLSDPAWAPAAGQPVVFYRGDRVIGGGFIEYYF